MAGSVYTAPVSSLDLMRARRPGLPLLSLCCALLLSAPLLSVLWHALGGSTAGTWQHLLQTVLPAYVRDTLSLAVGVALGVSALGVGSAWLVTRYEFPGRGVFEWALVLPLAMPAYVLAYTYTDLLQFVGPVQTQLRAWTGWGYGDYWFPPIRSLGGAAAMLALALYPYVYLLVRTAFLERGGSLFEAARSLGCGPWQGFLRVALPLARPAWAAGVALALMETLADYGTVSYFGVQTFTTGIYRAWFSLGDRHAAVQLALVLLVFVVLLLVFERRSRAARRYHDRRPGGAQPPRQPLSGLAALLAALAVAVPLVLGFVVPVTRLAWLALFEAEAGWAPANWRLLEHSVLLAGSAALVATALALLLAYAARLRPVGPARWALRLAGLGYALPGSVIAVGVLVPVTQLDHLLAGWAQSLWGGRWGLLLTGSVAALVYACVVRYLAAALQAVEAGLQRVTPHMDEAARSLGFGPAATLRRVHLPMLRGSLWTALLLVFIDVMKELPATLVMRPFDFDTLATLVYTLASDERLAEAAVAALAIVGAGLLPLIVLCRQIARGSPAAPAGEAPAVR